MWICEKCNEENEDSFESCWKCFPGSDLEKKQIEEANILDEENRKKTNKLNSKIGRGFLAMFMSLIIFMIINSQIENSNAKIAVVDNFIEFIILSIACYYIIKSVFKKK